MVELPHSDLTPDMCVKDQQPEDFLMIPGPSLSPQYPAADTVCPAACPGTVWPTWTRSSLLLISDLGSAFHLMHSWTPQLSFRPLTLKATTATPSCCWSGSSYQHRCSWLLLKLCCSLFNLSSSVNHIHGHRYTDMFAV